MHLYRSLFALVLLVSVNAYRILLVYPLPLRSLNKLGEGFARHLLNAGHEVTFVTHYPIKTVTDSLRQIDISSNIVEMSDNYTFTIRSVMNSEAVVNDVKVLQDYAIENSIASLGHKNFKEFLEDTSQSFDAVLVDYYEIEIYASIASLYDCPMIWATSMGPHWQALRLIDQPSNPAYTADYLSSNNAPFTFRQRVEELWAQIKWNWLKWTYTLPKEKEAFENIFRPLFEKRGKSLPDYNTLLYNVSLMFSNDHNTFGGVPSIPQSMKLIGGYHIEYPPKPLPKDLQQLMDNAKHGVIYFSMGSIWSSKDFPKSTIEDLLKVFGKLQQIVIWKFEDDLSNVPANVKIMKWAPQPSILYHPNCVVFVTHGGLLSSTESIHFGVPIIGIPIFFDQFLNINKAVSNGYAIRVPLNYELPKNLEVAIQTMLSDPKYKKLAKDFSSIYHHRPLPPGKEAVHWIEHVIKTGGAIHLRSPALNVPFYQKFYLDLTAILFFIIFMFSKIVKVMLSRKYSDLKGIKEKKN